MVGVYSYSTRAGERWLWKADVNGRLGKRKGYLRQKDAADARALWVAEQLRGLGLAGGRGKTCGAFWKDDWTPRLRAKVAAGELRSSTAAQYERDVRVHLEPAFGSRRLADVTVEDVERFADRLAAGGLSSDTVRRVVNTLGYSLKLARRWRLIAFNPVTDAEKPKPRRRRPHLPTLADVERLAGLMPTRESRGLVLFAAQTGVRKSECFGLRWSSVDLTEGDERVRIVEQFYKGELVPSTKTSAGSREIILAPRAAAVLRELSVSQQIEGRPNPLGLVFPSPAGAHWLDTNFDRRVWGPARRAAGLPELTFHTLRYFYVSHVRAQGLAAPITEQLTGHADERTHRGYTRPIAGTEGAIREALGRAFGGAA